MKKILALVLTLTLLCCSALTLAETATAMMTLYVTDFMGMNPADMGIEMAITLYTDNTASFAQGEDALTGTWTEQEDGSVLVDFGEDGGQILLVANEDGTVTGFDPASDMSITLSPEAPVAAELPAIVAADDASAFEGNWELNFLVLNTEEGRMILPLADLMASPETAAFLGLSEDTSLTIANSAVTLFGKELGEFNFENGVLILPVYQEDMNLTQCAALCEDGSLCYTLMEGIDLYYVLAE